MFMMETWGADSSDGVPPWAADVGEAEDSSLELEVGEEVRQAEVLVAVLAAENLKNPTPFFTTQTSTPSTHALTQENQVSLFILSLLTSRRLRTSHLSRTML